MPSQAVQRQDVAKTLETAKALSLLYWRIKHIIFSPGYAHSG